MAQQGRVRRSSFEPNPAAMQFFQQDVYSNSGSYKQQDPLSMLLGQDMATAAAAAAAAGMSPGNMNGFMHMNGLSSMSAAGIAEQQHFAEPLCMPPGSNGYDCLPLEAEEPGPLPCLPRPNRMAGGYGSSAALLMQQQQLQQLQRCGYPSSGAPGPGGGRGLRPRRHSVTIGMLNEHQQQQALLAAAGGQLPQGWLGGAGAMPGSNGMPSSGQPPRMPMLPQQSSPNKQLQELHMQAAAAQLGLGKAGLGQGYMNAGGAGPRVLHAQQLAGNAAAAAAAAAGLTGPGSGGNPQSLMEPLPSAYGMNNPRMPGNGNSRRHSWAPMGAEGSMAYARSWLLQQQQGNGSLTAQLGDARALFVNQQQQDQLGIGRVAPPLLRTPRNGLDNGAAAAYNATGQGLLDPTAGDHHLAGFGGVLPGQMSVAQPSPVMPLYGTSGDVLAKEQLAQHLQHQLQLQELASRLNGGGQGLDPYAEPFVSQGQLLGQHAAGLAGMDAYATALQQELQQQQQQQSALALQLCEDAGLSPATAAAAASMYAPLQINGVSVDTQLLVSPYADNWDMLGQSSAGGSLSGSAVSSNSGMSALAGVGMAGAAVAGPLGQLGMAGKAAKGHGALMQMSSSASSSGSGSIANTRGSHISACTPSSSSGSNSGIKGGAAAGAPPAAAAAAAATMLASLPPLSKVCSEAPWNLKKAADEDAKVMSAQQVQLHKLTAALERSRTLQAVHAAEDAAAEASAACAAAAAASRGGSSVAADTSGVSADNAAALFGYRLPDSGDDTWGGSSGSDGAAAAAVVPGGSCISQEPSNKLFVGNIGWWVTEEDLLHWFSRFGIIITVKIMYNSRKMHKPKDKWRSREYGFIDYASPDEAAKAIVWMDGVELPDLMKDTCGIIVQYAKPTGSGEANAAAAVPGS